jgi:hypothetical protein
LVRKATLVAWPAAGFWRKVPEAKGRSLEEIEQDLAVEPGAVESVPMAASQADPAASH